jgi:hypothetical protein
MKLIIATMGLKVKDEEDDIGSTLCGIQSGRTLANFTVFFI